MPTVVSLQDVIDVLETLPSEKLQDVYQSVLSIKGAPSSLDYDDHWSEEDMEAAARTSLADFDEEFPGNFYD